MIDWVKVPAGELCLDAERPDRFRLPDDLKVLRLEKDLWVSCSPISEQQWGEFRSTSSTSRLPKIDVSFEDTLEFADWAKGPEGQPCRLLTSEEWEYACRAGTSTVFAFGDDLLPEHANFLYTEQPAKVGRNGRSEPGRYPANAFGLYDMHGNVCEWTSTVFKERRVIRGGAWDYLPRLLRSSWWTSLEPSTKRDNLGFRIAAEVVES